MKRQNISSNYGKYVVVRYSTTFPMTFPKMSTTLSSFTKHNSAKGLCV